MQTACTHALHIMLRPVKRQGQMVGEPPSWPAAVLLFTILRSPATSRFFCSLQLTRSRQPPTDKESITQNGEWRDTHLADTVTIRADELVGDRARVRAHWVPLHAERGHVREVLARRLRDGSVVRALRGHISVCGCGEREERSEDEEWGGDSRPARVCGPHDCAWAWVRAWA